jgi:hypothetical protein
VGAPLVSITDVQALMPGAVTSADTAALTFLILAVSDYARNMTDREFWITNYTESYRGRNGGSIPLKQRPVTAVSGLSVDNVSIYPSALDASNNPITSGYGFWFDNKAIYLGGGYRFRYSDFPNVVVSYSAGYATLGDYAGLKAAVGDLYYALCLEVTNQYRHLSHVGLKSEGMQGQSTTYDAESDLPQTQLILDNYRRTWMA